MLTSLYTYLASLPAEHTAALIVLGALTPILLVVQVGFAACHAADVAAARREGL